jgi:GAF domain-containing protein
MISLISSFYSRYFSVRHPYNNPMEQQRARGLLGIVAVCLIAWAIAAAGMIGQLIAGGDASFFGGGGALIIVAAPIVLGLIAYNTQRGELRSASWLLMGLFIASAMVSLFAQGPNVASLLIPTLAAGLLLDRSAVLLVTLIVVVLAAFSTQTAPGDNEGVELLLSLLSLAVTVGFFLTFGGTSDRVVYDYADTIRQLQQVSRLPLRSTASDDMQVYGEALHLIRDELAFPYTQIFLPDETGRLTQRVLPASAAQGGSLLLTATLGDANMLYEVLRGGRTVIVSQYDNEIRRGHLLVSSRYSIGVPIRDQNEVAAVLDVQVERYDLPAVQVEMLEALADMIGYLVRDTRERGSMRAAFRQEEETSHSLRARLDSIQQVARQSLGSTWDEYLEKRGVKAIGFDVDVATGATVPAYDLPPLLQRALESAEMQIEDTPAGQVVNVPLVLRGEVLGALSFITPPGTPITERQRDMVRSVADRLAESLESKRLFEQSRSQAIRERKANEVASLLISATDVDAVLNLAADSFNQTLGAIRTRIHLQPRALAELSDVRSSETKGNPT